MDAKTMLLYLQDNSKLKTTTTDDWNKMVDKYPYFAAAQMLKYAVEKQHDKDDMAYAALYKQDPLLFAEWVNTDTSILEETVEITTKNEKPEIITEVKKETPVIIIAENEKSEILTEVKKETPKAIVTDPKAPAAIIVEEKKEKIIEVKKEEINTVVAEKDILEMINELPNSNPIELNAVKITEKVDKKEAIKEEEPVKIISTSMDENTSISPDKSLMVMMSFTDWLNFFKHKQANDKEEAQSKKALKTSWQKEKLTAAMEEDVDEIPEPIFQQAMESITMESSMVSESLAKILASQGKVDKAIDMYKKLILRFPEKRTYFADLIEKLNLKRD